jgi:hypothetical protein
MADKKPEEKAEYLYEMNKRECALRSGPSPGASSPC